MTKSNAQMKAPPSAPDVCQVLCDILKDGIDVHQCAAAKALKQVDDVRATKALIQALLDQDEDVRADAAAALVGRKDAGACRQLLENLIGDPCGEVKISAIDALVAARDGAVVPWLRRLAVSADEEVIWDEDGQIADGWDDWADVQLAAIAALGELKIEDAAPDILAVIIEGDGQDVSEVGCKALAHLGLPGITALETLLDQPDERYRRRAAAGLASFEAPEAASGVVKALGDKTREVRLATGRVLAARDPGDMRLELLLLDPVPEVRVEAIGFCGAAHPHRLDLLLDDASASVAGAVVAVLAKAPTLVEADLVVPRIYDIFVDFADKDPNLAGTAAQALAALDPEGCHDKLIAVAGDAGATTQLRIGALKGLARIGGDAAIQTLIDVLGGDDRQVRLEAMSLLLKIAFVGEFWPNPAGDVLLDALNGDLVPAPEPDANPAVTGEQAQEAQEAQEAGATLESLVEDEPGNPDGEISDAFPMSTLASIMSSDAEGEQALPAEEQSGLGNDFDEKDLEFLGLAQSSAKTSKKRVALVPQVAPHTDVQLLAARLLGDLPRDGVADALAQKLGSRNDEIAAAAADSMAHLAANGDNFSPDAEKRLIGTLGASDRSKRLCAIRALAATGSELAVMPLVNLLRDEDSFIRTEAIRALVRLGANARGVRDLLDDPDPSVRLAAARAVGHLGGEDAIETLGEFALAFEGTHGREAARIIGSVDRDGGDAFFVEVLADAERKRFWQVAIDALAELNQADAGAPPKLNF